MIRILIVDDHHLFSAGLAAILQNEPDFEVAGQVGSVAAAAQAACDLQPDIVLMDFNLPDGKGPEATRRVLAVHPGCKVVFLTMSEKEEDLLAAIRSGAVGYLVKNMNPIRLMETLRSVHKGESAISRSMTLSLIKALSRQGEPETAQGQAIEKLTQREKEILPELAAGKSNQEIAARLFVSENTVKFHVHSILKKLNLEDRKEVARFVKEQRLKE